MPTIPFPRPARPEARAFDALLAGTCQPEEAPAELRAVAEVFAALRAPSDQREVASWEDALTAYRGMADLPEAPRRSHRRRPRRAASPLGARLAAAASVAAVAVLGGGVAAAYTGNLPAPLQGFAHHVIAAPSAPETSAMPTPHGSVRPVGPPATGSAAYGLCRAFEQAKEHGKADQNSPAYRNLVIAAGGAGHVTAYCAAVQQPGRREGQSGSPGHSSHQKHRKPDTTPSPTPTPAPSQGNGDGHKHHKQPH